MFVSFHWFVITFGPYRTVAGERAWKIFLKGKILKDKKVCNKGFFMFVFVCDYFWVTTNLNARTEESIFMVEWGIREVTCLGLQGQEMQRTE